MRHLGAIASILVFASCSHTNPWEKIRTPAPGPAHIIGAYSSGCMIGAEKMDLQGEGFELMRPSRGRFYGYPTLVSYLKRLGAKLDRLHLGPILVGDMAQPRGGPFTTGHKSHQTGLDVDIWFLRLPQARVRLLSMADRETISSHTVLAKDRLHLDSRYWLPRDPRLLRVAAQFPEVDRIFVNPAIKKSLCRRFHRQKWLAKLRPWFGHDDHFHVRLKCPVNETECVNPADPIPPGNGCDATLDWWFSDEAKEAGKASAKKPGAEIRKVPEACKALLD